MHSTKNSKKNVLTVLVIIAIALLAAVGIILFLNSRLNILPQVISSTTTASAERATFPEIPADQLTQDQQDLVAILKTEYNLNPAGTKYSEGIEEAWCADFVSWVYKEAGMPLSNPNSGSWRIPGTFTLREYYESIDTFQPASSGYTPKIGDVMLYDNPSTFGQHTNVVVGYKDGVVTTIGGNEPGGIRVIEHKPSDDKGFIGYGVLPS